MNDSDFNNTFSFNGPIEMLIDSQDNSVLEAPEIKIALSVLLIVILVLSVVGNLCTCAVISRDKTMRTPTNLYLFNLAVADFCMALFIPIEIYTLLARNHYPFGEFGCRVHILVLFCAGNVSTLTIFVFTVERYLVVSKPFLRPSLAKISRVSVIVSVIWVVSFVIVLPEAYFGEILLRKKYAYCCTTFHTSVKVLAWLQLIIFYIVPMVVIFSLYVIIAAKFEELNPNRGNPVRGIQNKERAVRMLAMVAFSFFFCWSPILLMRLMMLQPQYDDDEYYNMWRVVNYVSLVNGYLSSAINPILYGVMSSRFRNAFRKMFREIMAAPRTTSNAISTTPNG